MRGAGALVIACACLGLALGAGCVPVARPVSPHLTEVQPLTKGLNAYRTIAVSATADGAVPVRDVMRSQLENIVVEDLAALRTPATLATEGADLLVKLSLVKLDQPKPYAIWDATVNVEIVDGASGAVIGRLEVIGTSFVGEVEPVRPDNPFSTEQREKANRENLKHSEEPKKHALRSAADMIAAYIVERRDPGR